MAGEGLFERDPELAALRRAVEGRAGGRARLVLVEGAAGVGKSRLLGAAGDLAAAQAPGPGSRAA